MPDILEDTKNWFEKAIPEPTDLNIHTQLGVHFEEVAEMIETLTPTNAFMKNHLHQALVAVQTLSKALKGQTNQIMLVGADRVDFLDAICDQIVTATGCGYMAGMDVVGGMNEVNRSNYSKFDAKTGEPIFDDNRKVMKGPNYTKADLSEFAG